MPGEVFGYEALLNEIGSHVKWENLFSDAILMAEQGITVDKALSDLILYFAGDIREQSSLKCVLITSPH